MKKIIYLFLILIPYPQIVAQDEQQVSFGLYKWKTNVPLEECSRDGTTLGTKIDSESGQSFRVIDFIGDTAIIYILGYTKTDANGNKIPSDQAKFFKYNFNSDLNAYNALNTIDKNSREYSSYQRYFLVPKSYIIANGAKFLGKGLDLSVGILTLPLKLRLKDGDFTGSFTIGGTGGVKWRARSYSDKFYHNIVLGFGLSNITLDSLTVTKSLQIDQIREGLSLYTTRQSRKPARADPYHL